MRLRDKVVVITGSGSGLGRESALLFASEGDAPCRCVSTGHQRCDGRVVIITV